MGTATLSQVAYRGVTDRVHAAGGSATFAGEERVRKGLGLDPLVDPKGFDVIRRSISRKGQKGDLFELLVGIAMLVESRLDTTGSMRNNVGIAMRVLPSTYELLASGKNAVLSRYDTQMITSIFGDVLDNYVLCRSQAEMDVKIAEQMTLMVPEGGGKGNGHENPEYGLFGAAFLTAAEIVQYGLKSYDFTVSDEPLLDRLDTRTLVRVFGDSVFEKVTENGFTIDKKNLPSTTEVVAELLKHSHAFFLHVLHNDGHDPLGYDRTTTAAWTPMFGQERIVILPNTEFLPHVQAAIIGLTEGVLDLRTVGDFLREGGMSAENAKLIVRAVAGIPIGAQAALPNFNKLPKKGDLFAKKGDLWPLDGAIPVEEVHGEPSEDKIWG